MRENYNPKTLVILTGPTAVGKTQTSIGIAHALGAEIISADARQFYHELKIGTAAPTPDERAKVRHHLAGHLSIFDYYNASIFENQALEIIKQQFQHCDYVVASGGSGLYLDALCSGIDEMPDIDPLIRQQVQLLYQQQGLEGLRRQLKLFDPEYYTQVDTANPNRMIRGIEVFMATGTKYSSLRKKQSSHRPFRIKRIILNRPRTELFDRINLRTEIMVHEGIIEEAISFFTCFPTVQCAFAIHCFRL
jgi:tRNA dimethylallyltransferase